MNNKKVGVVISMSMLFGIAAGNILGLLVGSVFMSENLSVALLIGNISGSIIGLLVGTIIAKIKDNEK